MKQTVKSIVTIEEVENNLGSMVVVKDNKSRKSIFMLFASGTLGFNIFDKDGVYYDTKLTLVEAVEVYNKL